MTFKQFDEVVLKERTEISPLFYINSGIKGVVMDKTVPEYYLVRFEGYGAYWVDGSKLIFSSTEVY